MQPYSDPSRQNSTHGQTTLITSKQYCIEEQEINLGNNQGLKKVIMKKMVLQGLEEMKRVLKTSPNRAKFGSGPNSVTRTMVHNVLHVT